MAKILVVGYGTIGQRLADGVAQQDDMELVGIADAAVNLVLDATSAGVGAKNKELYKKYGVKAIFQGGREKRCGRCLFPRICQL